MSAPNAREKAPERRMTEKATLETERGRCFRLLAFDDSAFIAALQPTLILDETGDRVHTLARA